MLFTDGKYRYYENLMREIPNFKKRTSGEYRPVFRYRFRDIDCRFCAEYKTCPSACLCPYILDNLSELRHDREFIDAVRAAEACVTRQRETLLWLSNILPI